MKFSSLKFKPNMKIKVRNSCCSKKNMDFLVKLSSEAYIDFTIKDKLINAVAAGNVINALSLQYFNKNLII